MRLRVAKRRLLRACQQLGLALQLLLLLQQLPDQLLVLGSQVHAILHWGGVPIEGHAAQGQVHRGGALRLAQPLPGVQLGRQPWGQPLLLLLGKGLAG